MSDLFPMVKGLSRGYNPEQVDAFFAESRTAYEGGVPADTFSAEQIYTAAFDLVRGGYDPKPVDAALNRLEAAFIQRDRSNFVAEHGENKWFEKIADDATVLYPRLLRPQGDRFLHPEGRARGYSAVEVDAFLDRIAAFFDDRDNVTEAAIRTVTFKSARGEAAYNEAQVDAFLGAATRVLMAVS
ncbi:DivIVA domain-containing protein [Actinomyces minihominis]|uniref:DivIVA domain-containing protein n=1 Tax=Actinomyces minihominis TaxID=2002838 RepID=UPI000C089B9D|nr:DivIVA domain-containing protein [Actinomyces minihominis]